jgi:hypothetical protein
MSFSRLIFFKVFYCVYFLFLCGCNENFLDKKPQGELSEFVLAGEEGLEALLIGAYAELDGFAGWEAGDPWRSSGSNWIYGDVYTDDAYKGTDAGDSNPISPLEWYEADASNPNIRTKWMAMYDGVSRTNDVLDILAMAGKNHSIDATTSIQIEAEARFLRAYYHLELVKMFDFIPYINEKDEYFQENHPPSDVGNGDAQWGGIHDGIPWEDVEEDLGFAIEHLPELPRNGEVGRITIYGAIGILARVKMFQGNFEEALPLLNRIIDSGLFQLAPSFHDNFRTLGDNNAESIFQIQATVNDGSSGGYNGNYGDILNFPYTGGPGKCCGFYQPSENLVNAFKTLHGLPYLHAFGLDFNAPGDDVINDMGYNSNDTTFIPDTRPLDPRLDWTVGRRGIPYLDWGLHPGRDWIRDQTYAGPYSPIKNVYYLAEEGTFSHTGGWGGGISANNYSIIRYADVLLMAAECEVEIGSLNKARDLVNQVRERARRQETWVKMENGSYAANYEISLYPASGSLNPFNEQETAREAVRFERRLELAMEGHRFWELKRWGVAKKRLNDYLEIEKTKRTYLYGAEFEDKNIRFPIPQTAIDRSERTLYQNPGY